MTVIVCSLDSDCKALEEIEFSSLLYVSRYCCHRLVFVLLFIVMGANKGSFAIIEIKFNSCYLYSLLNVLLTVVEMWVHCTHVCSNISKRKQVE